MCKTLELIVGRNRLVAAAAFGDLEALEQLLTGEGAGLDTNAEPDYSTSVAYQREVIPPGSPVSSQP